MKSWKCLNPYSNIAQDTKHERLNFYRLVYQTVRGKMDMALDQLKSLVLGLLGDKDQEKIFDAVTKVEKRHRQKCRDGVTMTPYDKRNRGRNPRDLCK